MTAKVIAFITRLRKFLEPIDDEPSPEMNPIILTHGPDITIGNWLNLTSGDTVRINGREGVIDTVDEDGIHAFLAESKEDARRCNYADVSTTYPWDQIRTLHIV